MKTEPQFQDPEQKQDEQERGRGQKSLRQDKGKSLSAKRPRVLDDGLDDNGVHLQLVDKFQNTSVEKAIRLKPENLKSVITIIDALSEKEMSEKKKGN